MRGDQESLRTLDLEQVMTVIMKAGIYVNNEFWGYQKIFFDLLHLVSSKKERSPDVKHQFDGGA